jgi:hypothetical protein
MSSPPSPYIASDASSKKWWDPLGLFASKSAPASPPGAAPPAAEPVLAGRRRRGGVLPRNKPAKPVTSKSQLNSQRAMIKLAIKNSMKKNAKGGRKTKKHSRK